MSDFGELRLVDVHQVVNGSERGDWRAKSPVVVGWVDPEVALFADQHPHIRIDERRDLSPLRHREVRRVPCSVEDSRSEGLVKVNYLRSVLWNEPKPHWVRIRHDELELVFRESEECIEYRLGVLVHPAAGAGTQDNSDSFHSGCKIPWRGAISYLLHPNPYRHRMTQMGFGCSIYFGLEYHPP